MKYLFRKNLFPDCIERPWDLGANEDVGHLFRYLEGETDERVWENPDQRVWSVVQDALYDELVERGIMIPPKKD